MERPTNNSRQLRNQRSERKGPGGLRRAQRRQRMMALRSHSQPLILHRCARHALLGSQLGKDHRFGATASCPPAPTNYFNADGIKSPLLRILSMPFSLKKTFHDKEKYTQMKGFVLRMSTYALRDLNPVNSEPNSRRLDDLFFKGK